MRKVVSIPKKLALTFNRPFEAFHYFSLGEVVDQDIFNPKDEKYKVHIKVVDDPEVFVDDSFVDYSNFYKVSKDSIYYQRTYSKIECKMFIKNLLDNETTVYCNNAYLRFVRMKLDNMYPVGIHVTDLLLYKMIKNDDLVVHAGGLSSKSGSFLMIAPPDTGKTYTTYTLMKDKGYKFLGEDLTYYQSNGNKLICMPYTSTWGHHFSPNRKPIKRVPFVGMFFNARKDSVIDFFPKSQVLDEAPLDRIYIIEKGKKNSLKRITDKKEVIRKVTSVQRNEYSYFKNPLLRAFEYTNNIDIDSVFDKEASSIKKMIENNEVYLATGTSYKEFSKIIDENEKLLLEKTSSKK